ncbi:hypothetical protein D9611_007337 [Ephemerocybe angulata]|uniref:Uncharacterized protein n=1 Tax=Ephemerocybe angulata TaxID=980116 RepID=A0A8H5FL19_9AGAR|nr:hypothetical protein D9611_007337 [Tulosesus angulatus]
MSTFAARRRDDFHLHWRSPPTPGPTTAACHMRCRPSNAIGVAAVPLASPETQTWNKTFCTTWLQSAVALNAAATLSLPTLPLPYVARYPILSTVSTSPTPPR